MYFINDCFIRTIIYLDNTNNEVAFILISSTYHFIDNNDLIGIVKSV